MSFCYKINWTELNVRGLNFTHFNPPPPWLRHWLQPFWPYTVRARHFAILERHRGAPAALIFFELWWSIASETSWLSGTLRVQMSIIWPSLVLNCIKCAVFEILRCYHILLLRFVLDTFCYDLIHFRLWFCQRASGLTVNPISGRLLATPISGKGGLFRTPLDISGTYQPIFKIQTAFVLPQHDLHF